MSGKPVYRDESRIRHMANALAKIAEKSQGIERKDLVEGEDNTELIIHYLTILGEASNNVSDAYAAEHPEIDFKGMASLRHKLVHDYANIDMDIIWDVITNDIPVQHPAVKALAETLPVPDRPVNLDEFA